MVEKYFQVKQMQPSKWYARKIVVIHLYAIWHWFLFFILFGNSLISCQYYRYLVQQYKIQSSIVCFLLSMGVGRFNSCSSSFICFCNSFQTTICSMQICFLDVFLGDVCVCVCMGFFFLATFVLYLSRP